MLNRIKEIIFKKPLHLQFLTLACALYFSVFLNLAFWRYLLQNIAMGTFSTALFIISMFAVLFLVFNILFNIVLLPYIAKPLLAILILTSAAVSYFMVQLNVFVDIDMLRNVVQTNTGEALDLLTFKYCLWVLFFGIVPTLYISLKKIYYPSFTRCLLQKLKAIIISILIIVLLVPFCYKDYAPWWRNHREARKLVNPSNYIYAAMRYIQKQTQTPRQLLKLDVNALHKPYNDDYKTVFILIIGETARAANFSLNDYARQTNPLLAKQDIAYFKNISAAGTSTAISVPAIFSAEGKKTFEAEKAKYMENLLDLLKNVGYDVLWKENNGGCKDVCKRVETIIIDPKKNPQFCDGTYCHDAILIEDLQERLKNITHDTFIVLHTIGSHGPTYYRRYPKEFKVFTPTCDTQDIQSCTREQIINTYDNTILYTDYIVNETIETLKKFPQLEAGLMYVSDHGESLGEKNIYLHSLPYAIAPKEQTKVPMLIWMSQTMQKEDYIDYNCLKDLAKNKQFAHQNIFHALLGLMEVNSKTYDKGMDFFHTCRTKPLP